jgi:hypothetical protein
MSMLYSKILLTIGVIAALFFSMVPGTQVFAAPATIVRENAVTARATWPGPVGQFSNIMLFVDKSSAGTDVFLRFDTPTIQGAFGFLTTTANVFQVTNGLTSATLSPVTLDVLGYGPVTIQATWTGLGSPSVSTITENININGGHMTTTVTGTSRPATSIGTMNGENLGQSSSALIGNFRHVQITTSTFTGGP